MALKKALQYLPFQISGYKLMLPLSVGFGEHSMALLTGYFLSPTPGSKPPGVEKTGCLPVACVATTSDPCP